MFTSFLLSAVRLPAVFIAMLFILSCSTGKKTGLTDSSSANSLERMEITAAGRLASEAESQARTYYIRGTAALQLNDLEMAETWLNRALPGLPHSSGAHYTLARLYMEKEDFVNAAYYGRIAVDLEPNNKWYRMLLVDAYRSTGQHEELIHQLDSILVYHPGDIQTLYTKARFLSARGEYRKSNQTYERILQLTGPDRSIFFQRISNFTKLDDTEAIIAELQNILKIDQSNIHTQLMLSQFYLEENRIEEARELLEQILRRSPGHPETLVNLADLYMNEEEWDKAGSLLLTLAGDTLVSTGNKLEILQYVISRYSVDSENEPLGRTASALVDTMLVYEPANGMIHALASELYSIKNDTDQSLYHLRQTTELLPENDAAWRQLVQTFYVEGRYTEAIEYGKKADQFVPDDVFIHFFVGGSYFLEKEYEKAAAWLNTASDAPAQPAFRSIILGILGDTYASMEKWERSDKSYEESIALDPENDVAMNNYAYSLAERETELEKAWELSRMALDKNPDNAAYLDTMGWIYFKKGDYENARKYLRASIDTGNASAEVMEHMGNLYDRIGEPDRALYWWQKALEKDETRIYLRDRLNIN